jgi:hypothetical protein
VPEALKIRKLRDVEGDVWEGNDEIGWTLDTEVGESWLANRNQLYVIWGPLAEVEEE